MKRFSAVNIDLNYETRSGRCAWCWQVLPELDSHTVVRALREPILELRFHHKCWPHYQAVTGIGQADSEWTPQWIEELRLQAGLDQLTFARKLHTNPERLRRIMAGDKTAITPTLRRELKALSRRVRFDGSPIDWSDHRAFFCLVRHLGWSILDVHRETGAAQSTIKAWLHNGVPRSRASTWAKLTRLAQLHRFDGAMIVDDRCWTSELLARAVESSGKSIATWAALSGLTEVGIRRYRLAKDQITRIGAWKLTRAAVALGLPLPAVGRVPYARPAQQRHQPTNRKRRWTAEMVALLGTMSDASVGKQLGLKTAAVAKHRARLGIDAYVG